MDEGTEDGGKRSEGAMDIDTALGKISVVDLEDGRRTDLPDGSWVCELVSAALNGAERTCMGFSTWKPGASTKQMVHETEEMAYIVCGEGKLSVGDKFVSYRAGQGVLIPAGVPHGVVNDSDKDLTMVYIFSYPEYPPTKPVGG
jgi:quercetin dioxygenase-like cupin family protein